jgi:predicted DNA-binding protein YlxM (UPF0122 family)
MKEGSDFDEIEEGDNDRLFSLEELLSETEVKEGDISEKMLSEKDRASLLREIHGELLNESDRDELVKDCISEISFKGVEKEIIPEEVSKLYLEDGLSLKEIGEHFGFKSGKPIKRILESAGVEIKPVGFQKMEIDPDEVHRLYFEERKDLKEIAETFGCKSTTSIHRIFEEQGWKTRYQDTYEKEIDPDEVFRLYNEDGLSLRKIGEHFGVSIGPIRRIFEEHNMEYGREIQIDPDVIHHLYFEEGLSKEEVCECFGVSKRPIDRIFDEQGWDARPAGVRGEKVTLSELRQKYDEKELTIEGIANQLKVSQSSAVRLFLSLEAERPALDESPHIDLDEFKELYYEKQLPVRRIADHFRTSQHKIRKFIFEQELEKRTVKTVAEIRDEMFGTNCVSCGKPRNVVHKKDGQSHHRRLTWTKVELQNVNPDEWAALCEPCHKLVHSLMSIFNLEWNNIEKILKEIEDKRGF